MHVIHTITTISEAMPLALVRGRMACIRRWQR
jgi:hypothetical protein